MSNYSEEFVEVRDEDADAIPMTVSLSIADFQSLVSSALRENDEVIALEVGSVRRDDVKDFVMDVIVGVKTGMTSPHWRRDGSSAQIPLVVRIADEVSVHSPSYDSRSKSRFDHQPAHRLES